MDFLKDCMSDVQNPPLDQFQRNWCLVCANRECERAGMNQSAFDHRAKNWKSILFDNVPRAAPDDPKYDNVRSKLFLPSGARATEAKVFVPGTPVAEPPEPARPRPAAFVKAQPPPSPEQEAVAPPVPEAPVPSPSTAAEAEPERAPSGPVASPGNTAFQQGAMLEGAPPEAPSPKPEEARSPPAPGKTFILDDD